MAAQNGGATEQAQEEATEEVDTQILTDYDLGAPWSRPDVDISKQTIQKEYYPLQMFINSNTGALTSTKIIALEAGDAGGAGAGIGAKRRGGYRSEEWTPDERTWMQEYWAQSWPMAGAWMHPWILEGIWQPPVLGFSYVTEAIEFEDGTATTQLGSSLHLTTLHYISIFEDPIFDLGTTTGTTADVYGGPALAPIDLNEQRYLGSLFGYPAGGVEGSAEYILTRATTLAQNILISDVENQIINPLIVYGRLKDKS